MSARPSAGIFMAVLAGAGGCDAESGVHVSVVAVPPLAGVSQLAVDYRAGGSSGQVTFAPPSPAAEIAFPASFYLRFVDRLTGRAQVCATAVDARRAPGPHCETAVLAGGAITRMVIDVDLAARWDFEVGAGAMTPNSALPDDGGVVVGAPVDTDGKVGRALRFDGKKDYVNLGASAALSFGGSITMAAWVNPGTNDARADNAILGNIFIDQSGAKGGAVIFLWVGEGGHAWQARVSNQAGESLLAGPSTPLVPNAWQHVAMTYDDSTLVFYLDGQPVNNAAGAGRLQPPSNGNPMVMAKHPYAETYFNGALDDVRLYRRALDAQEVAALYARTTVIR